MNLFYDFLTWVFTTPTIAINSCLPKAAEQRLEFNYDHVILVCHSLGAVIARFALLRATESKLTWASKIRLVLFAPAHKGARIVALAHEVVSHFRFTAFFAGIKRIKSPLIDQLKKGSDELSKLETRTGNALIAYKPAPQGSQGATLSPQNQHLIAYKVCIAEREHIVFNDKFCQDPEGETIRHSTHTTVCKPRRSIFGKSFLKPLDALIGSLQ